MIANKSASSDQEGLAILDLLKFKANKFDELSFSEIEESSEDDSEEVPEEEITIKYINY